jgi:hypothetical protein
MNLRIVLATSRRSASARPALFIQRSESRQISCPKILLVIPNHWHKKCASWPTRALQAYLVAVPHCAHDRVRAVYASLASVPT